MKQKSFEAATFAVWLPLCWGSGFPGFNELFKNSEFCQKPILQVVTIEECLWSNKK